VATWWLGDDLVELLTGDTKQAGDDEIIVACSCRIDDSSCSISYLDSLAWCSIAAFIFSISPCIALMMPYIGSLNSVVEGQQIPCD
jgi:hypothetical protein